MNTISPLVIDLGANNTGVLMPHFQAGTAVNADRPAGVLIHIPDDKLTFAQGSRRTKRHQKRGVLRRKQAKRLFRLIMLNQFQFDINAQPRNIQEKLHHAFNNRGFSYLDEDLDEDALDNPDATAFIVELFPAVFDDESPLTEQLSRMSTDLEAIKRINESEPFKWDKDALKKQVAETTKDTEVKKAITHGFKALTTFVHSVINSKINGHKPRHQYLDDIAHDLSRSDKLKPVWNATGLNAAEAANLIGHISNLQLRVLRKYFNDEKMAGQGDGIWDAARMARLFRAYITSWHAKTDDEKERRNTLLDAIARHGDDITALWRTVDPSVSIPPMEDMNNRHPTRCASLLLDESILSRRLPQWTAISKALLQSDPNQPFAPSSNPSALRRFQALLDRAKKHDPWKLRSLVFFDDSKAGRARQAQDESMDRLNQAVGPEQTAALVSFARDYYTERDAADRGDWSMEWPNRVLKTCGRNCPRKSRIMHLQIGILLRKELTRQEVDQLKALFNSKERIAGNTTLHGIGEKAAEAQKTYGPALKTLLVQAAFKGDKKEKDPFLKLLTQCETAYDRIAGLFGVDTTQTDRFGKPFVLIQIFNLLEKDPHGSSATCRHCTEDNALRTRPYNENIANARRLPADAGRPFDGMLSRILERQAYEIAKAKIKQLEENPPADSRVFMPVILEQNSFEFALGLLSIRKKQIPDARKKAAKKEKGLLEGAETSVQLWQDKDARIRDDCQGICPYTGGKLSAKGQIDHIIPRSLSRDWGGGIYNSEANLIYCSIQGNTDKGERLYSLDQLKTPYLQVQFPEQQGDRNQIAAYLRASLPDLLKEEKQAISGFHGLTPQERKIIRHALFVEDLRGDVLNALQMQKKTRVNGTQKWLAKHIARNLRELARKQLPGVELDIRTYRVKAEDVHSLRAILTEKHTALEKTTPQPAYSHLVDAGMAWAVWLATSRDAQERIPIEENSLDTPDWLHALLPEGILIQTLAAKSKANKRKPHSQPLFKDGIFGNRFLNLIVHKDGTGAIGFHPRNALPIGKAPEQVFSRLQPVLRWNRLPVEGTWEDWTRKAETENKSLILAVDRIAGLDFLHKAAKEKLNPEDSRRAALLDALSYPVQKMDIRKALLEDPDRKPVLKARDAILAGKREKDGPTAEEPEDTGKKKSKPKTIEGTFSITVHYSPAKVKGKLVHPALKSWQAILDDPILTGKWGQSLSSEEWDALFKKHFERKLEGVAHQTVRKVYSLPVPAKLSGGWRIRRTAADGSPVWQTVVSDGDAYNGFGIQNGKPNWKKPSLLPHLLDSPRIHTVGYRRDETAGADPCRMDEWLKVEWTDDKVPLLAVEIAPGTADRLYARIKMKAEDFQKSFDLDNPLDLTPDWNGYDKWPLSIQGPRSHLFIEEIGPVITFWYIMKGAKTELKTAYDAAYAAKHGQ